MKWIIYQFYFDSYLFSTLSFQSDKFPNIMKTATYEKKFMKSLGPWVSIDMLHMHLCSIWLVKYNSPQIFWLY